MGKVLDQLEGRDTPPGVRCPICGQGNAPGRYCRHARWTFDQGGPIDFARFALDTSPYTVARGARAGDIPRGWWDDRGEWVVDKVLLHFDASDGYVFGEVAHLDLLARDIWREFKPEPERATIPRV